MQKQKEVSIIGFELKQQLGILKAHKLEFDKDNKLTVIKGGVGQGKTTEQKALQLGTQGSKTLVDKNLYGAIDTEIQLLDGDISIWVGCKSNDKGKLLYTLYTKDSEGKIVKEPIIDGVKATPAKYLETLQTELTWRMDELTSENPSVQKKILLSLYQHELTKLGVILDKKHPEYGNSILGQIETAENERNQKDSMRKQLGGIADDLKANGFDPDRPATIPDAIDISIIDSKIKEQERLKTVEETKAESGQATKLQEIKTKGAELVNECNGYNAKVQDGYNKEKETVEIQANILREQKHFYAHIINGLDDLRNNKALSIEDYDIIIKKVKESVKFAPELDEPKQPILIEFNENKQIITTEIYKYPKEAQDLLNKVLKLKESYLLCLNAPAEKVDTSKFTSTIEALEKDKANAEAINKIVAAVDSFHEWRNANETVVKLKNDYAKMLAKVDTGVEGLRIVPQETENNLDIFLMYNGAYDAAYFSNPDAEYRKLSSYSGTQKPVICLLIQNYLLSKKAKAMRYMYIDNVPMDKKTVELLKNMCEKLNLNIILNITGDFTPDTIKDGEILIEGGEVFFNNNN